MKRIYENRRIAFRMRMLMAALAGLVVLGVWAMLEIRPSAEPPGADGVAGDPFFIGVMLVVIAGLAAFRFGYYGMRTVTAFDLDEASGAIRLELWRPFGEETILSRIDELTGWAYHLGRKNTRMPKWRLWARVVGPRRRVLFELSPLAPIHPDLRRLAPEEIAQYERDSGIAALQGSLKEASGPST